MGETYDHFYYSIQKYKLVDNKIDAAKGIVTEDGKPTLMHIYGGDKKSQVLRSGIDCALITYTPNLGALIVIDQDEHMRNKLRVRLLSPKGELLASSKPFVSHEITPIRATSFHFQDLIAVQEDRGICIYDGDLKVVRRLTGQVILGRNLGDDLLITGVVVDRIIKEVRCYDFEFKITKKYTGVFGRPFIDSNRTIFDFQRTSKVYQIRNLDSNVPPVDVHGIDPSIDAYWMDMQVFTTYETGPLMLLGTRSPSSDGGRLHTHLINMHTGEAKFLMAGFCFGRSLGYSEEIAMAPMEWYGPYKRGGTRSGSLYFMDLKTGVKRPVSQRLGQIGAGCWWVNSTRV